MHIYHQPYRPTVYNMMSNRGCKKMNVSTTRSLFYHSYHYKYPMDSSMPFLRDCNFCSMPFPRSSFSKIIKK